MGGGGTIKHNSILFLLDFIYFFKYHINVLLECNFTNASFLK